MRLDIFSDTICPWCYIGKRRLERALAARPQPELSTRWRAFQLNASMPPEGMSRSEYLEAKFGGAERAERMHIAVQAAGAAEGIVFNFDRIIRTPNTLQSHRLLRFAGTKGLQEPMLEALFRAYFTEGEDLSETDVLVDKAGEVGLQESDVAAYLTSSEDVAAVLAEDRLARRQGINGVPCFVFNGRFALPGAQEPEALFQMFDLAREEQLAQTALVESA